MCQSEYFLSSQQVKNGIVIFKFGNNKHESGTSHLIYPAARKQSSVFPNMSNL